jgi:hypothetical protein
MYYLSFDVANKSLAVSFLYYNTKNLYNQIALLQNNKKRTELQDSKNYILHINNLIKDSFKYYYYDVKDLIPNQKVKETNIIDRSNKLKEYLSSIQLFIDNIKNTNNISKIYVLIEYQLASNYNANAIYNQIIYAFSNNELFEIVIMNPAYKNKIYFNLDLQHSRFIQQYANNYIANKNHCKANFLYFLKSFNLEYIVQNIKKKNIDDLADSFMQIFAFIKYIKNK